MRKAFVAAILTLILYCPCFGQSTPSSLDNILGNTATQKYGNKEGLNENLFKPVMSEGRKMKTMDDSKEFNAQLLCPSSQRFMEILIQPGSSGDISTLIVTQDTNFDGNLDYTYQAPFSVSGVCSNGVVGCNPGTWDDCRAYRWASDTSGKIFLQETLNTNLGGCYCINNSCGVNLVFNNTVSVIKSIGGGAVAAIHMQNTRYVVSGVKIDGMLASYFGQNAGNCSATSAETVNAEKYYHGPYTMESDAQATAAGQATDPSSLYSLMGNAISHSQKELKSCSISRAAAIVWEYGRCEIKETVQNHCEQLDSDPKCRLMEETVDSVKTYNNYNPTGLAPGNSCMTLNDSKTASCAYTCPSDVNIPCLGDPPVCQVGESTESCILLKPVRSVQRICSTGGMGGYGNGSNVLNLTCGTIEFHPGIKITGGGTGSAWCHSQGFAYNCDTNPGQCDGCPEGTTSVFGWSPLVSGGNSAKFCATGLRAWQTGSGRASQYAARIDNLYTTNGFNLIFATYGCCSGDYCDVGGPNYDFSGYTCPLEGASCIGVPGYCTKICNEDVCRDWWRKDRVYTCEFTGYDFSESRERVKTIKSSVQDNTSSVYYKDYRKMEDGSWVYEETTTNTSGVMRPVASSCASACKTRKLKEDTGTTIVEKKSDFRATTTSYEFFYKSCVGGSCPVGAGEEILKDCQCINDFAEAALIMQILRQSGEDLICSNGTRRALE